MCLQSTVLITPILQKVFKFNSERRPFHGSVWGQFSKDSTRHYICLQFKTKTCLELIFMKSETPFHQLFSKPEMIRSQIFAQET